LILQVMRMLPNKTLMNSKLKWTFGDEEKKYYHVPKIECLGCLNGYKKIISWPLLVIMLYLEMDSEFLNSHVKEKFFCCYPSLNSLWVHAQYFFSTEQRNSIKAITFIQENSWSPCKERNACMCHLCNASSA
jgi:hypothetical protein